MSRKSDEMSGEMMSGEKTPGEGKYRTISTLCFSQTRRGVGASTTMGVSRDVEWASTSWAIRVKAFLIRPPFSAVFVERVIARKGLHEKGRARGVAREE